MSITIRNGLLTKLGNRMTRKVGNNTYLTRDDANVLRLRLHSTDIITSYPNGETLVTSGGWKTPTTKSRLNDYLKGFSLHQNKGQWFWSKRNPDYTGTDDKPYWIQGGVFSDGDTIGPRGKLTTQAGANAVKESDRLTRSINGYAKLCSASVPLPLPGAGDCLYCQMSTDDGKSLGDATGDTEHLLSHIEEGYVVPSLVYRALKEHGCTDFIISITFGDGKLAGMVHHHVRRAVASYLKRRLGLCAGGGRTT